MSKLYPFNGSKHAHDIEFRINCICNRMHEMEIGDVVWDQAEYDANDAKLVVLEECMGYMHEGICWLPGRLIAHATESKNWAAMVRKGAVKNFR